MRPLLNFGVVWNAILLAVGVLWCRAIWARRREDWRTFRAREDRAQWNAVVFYWVVTAIVVMAMVNAILGLLG